MCRCVQVCAFFCAQEPTFVLASFFFCLLCFTAVAAVSCRLYGTVPQALKLSTMWRPRYISSRTASLCGPLVCVCWRCVYVGVMWVCYDTEICGMCYRCCCNVQSKKLYWYSATGVPTDYLVLPLFSLSSNTSAHAPCFLQHQLWRLCSLRAPFQLASPPRFQVTNNPKGNLVTWYHIASLFCEINYSSWY